MIRPVLTTTAFAALLGVNDRTVRRWIEAGELPEAAVRVSPGGRYRLLAAPLRAAGWLPAEVAAPAPAGAPS